MIDKGMLRSLIWLLLIAVSTTVFVSCSQKESGPTFKGPGSDISEIEDENNILKAHLWQYLYR